MRATMSYTVLRLAVFAALLGLLYLAGARGILLVGVAALASAAISYFALSRQRAAMAGSSPGASPASGRAWTRAAGPRTRTSRPG